MQLAVGGPRHGTLILDPDGHQVACDRAAFLWHEDVDHPNEEFEYTMGTGAAYVGVEPDPDNPPQVRPVWGTAEALNLAAQAKALVDGQPADPLLLSYGVHPQPGKPDHFFCLNPDLTPCPDLFTYWTAYGLSPSGQGIATAGPFPLADAYFLKDAFDNTVFGYTNTSASWPGQGVETSFSAQTSGESGGDFAGYTLTTTMFANPSMPQGEYRSTLSVAYPDDPAGDWLSGTVSKEITYDFQGGSSHALVQKQNYEQRPSDQGQAVVDGVMPMAVAPGAQSSSLATLPDGTTPRLVLLAVTGSQIPTSILAPGWATVWGEDEPTLDPTHAWTKTGGEWHTSELFALDAALDVSTQASFRLSLVDEGGQVVPGTAFRVYRCPRAEHLTPPDVPPGDCTAVPVDSEKEGDLDTGVLSSITLNEAGAQRGYLGIELTKAPVAPGQYYINVESLDPKTFRIRRQGQLVTGGEGETGEYQGAFAICVVLGGEILDENFQRVGLFTVNEPTTAYVRYIGAVTPDPTFSVDLRSYDGDGAQVDQALGVTLTRVGNSAEFLSQPIQLLPVWMENTAEPFLHADRSPDGTVEVTPAGQGASGQSQAHVMSSSTMAGKRPKPSSCMAWAATKSGRTYTVPLGTTLALRVYWGLGLRGTPRPYLCNAAMLGPLDCPTIQSAFIPNDQIDWMTMSEGDAEGEDQVARLEKEAGPSTERPTDPPEGWYLRGIRTTVQSDGTPARRKNGTPRVTGGKITVFASVGDLRATAGVEVIRPGTLGLGVDLGGHTIDGFPDFPVTFESFTAPNPAVPLLLKELILDAADEFGFPPQYLAAQMYHESSFNTYAFRYEPAGYDFLYVTGDHNTNYSTTTRKLFTTQMALRNLGVVATAGVAQFLPCETQSGRATFTACIPSDSVPQPLTVTLLPADDGLRVWQIPDLSGTKIRLGVTVFPDGGDRDTQAYGQIFPGDTPTGSDCEYTVDPDLGQITFYMPQGVVPAAEWRAVGRLEQPTPVEPPSFGSSIGDAGVAAGWVLLHNPSHPEKMNLPPSGTFEDIRGWMVSKWQSHPDIDPVAANELVRYRQAPKFSGQALWELMRRDPSFEVQGQWFAAASYGLMQLIPESHREIIEDVELFTPEETADLEATYYNPRSSNHNPLDRLFDPRICVRMGALEVSTLRLDISEGDDTSCPSTRTQCTWEHVWQRRLCKFWRGSGWPEGNGTCTYANDIMQGSEGHPGAESFLPQP